MESPPDVYVDIIIHFTYFYLGEGDNFTPLWGILC